MTPELVLLCLDWAVDIATIALGFAVILLAREHLPYFPGIVVLVTTKIIKGCYHAWVNWPLRDGAERILLQQPQYEIAAQVVILLGLIWALVLIARQNAVDILGHVDVDGRVHWYTPAFMRQRIVDTMTAAQGVDPSPQERPTPEEAEQRVVHGLSALAKFRRDRDQARGLG